MTEKYFAATPITCCDEILDLHFIMQTTSENFIMAYDKIMLKSKDFEDIYLPASENQLHFSG
jgi:hypothetical protein